MDSTAPRQRKDSNNSSFHEVRILTSLVVGVMALLSTASRGVAALASTSRFGRVSHLWPTHKSWRYLSNGSIPDESGVVNLPIKVLDTMNGADWGESDSLASEME